MKKLDIFFELFFKFSSIYYIILAALCIFDAYIPTHFAIGMAFINLSIFFWMTDVKFKGGEDTEAK